MEWLILIAVIGLGVPAWAWFTQERMIFFPQPVASTTHLPARASPLEVAATDGTHLRGWIVKGTPAPAPTVIYFGGNAEEVSWTLADARWPREWTIVGLNYRGYGASEGAPGERELTADALPAMTVARRALVAPAVVGDEALAPRYAWSGDRDSFAPPPHRASAFVRDSLSGRALG